MTEEEWRPFPVGSDAVRGNYEVSDLGRVRSRKRKQGVESWYVLKSRTASTNDNTPYPTVVVAGKKYYVHRLVCQAFHGDPPEGQPLALHGDGDHQNCRKDNLRWGNQTDNTMDALRHRGRHRQHLLTENEVIQIRSLFRRKSMGIGELSASFNLSRRTIHQIVNYKTWRHIP